MIIVLVCVKEVTSWNLGIPYEMLFYKQSTITNMETEQNLEVMLGKCNIIIIHIVSSFQKEN
jgi:hypothetical protein